MGLSFNSHVRCGAYAATLFRHVERLNNVRRRGSDGAGDRASPQHLSIIELHTLMRCSNSAGIQQNRDAGFFHLFPGEFAELGRYFGQDLVLGMNQGDHHIFLAEISIKARAAADKFIDFTTDFHTAEARTHDDEAEVPAPTLGVSSSLGMLHLVDDMLAKINGIAHNLEAKRMVGHSGDDSQVALGATRNHNVVIVQAGLRTRSVVKLNLRRMKVYPLYSLRAALDTGKHLT